MRKSAGRYLAAALASGGGLRVWETAGWILVGDDRDYGGKGSYGAAFDATDRLYTVAYDGLLRRYGGPDFKLEAKLGTFNGREAGSVAVHPNGDRVGFHDSSAVDVYRAEDLQYLFRPDSTNTFNGTPSAVAWSADGARLYAGGRYQDAHDRLVRIWSDEGHGKARDVAVAQDTILALLPCRDKIAVGTGNAAFGLISLDGEKLVWQESASPDMRWKLSSNFTVLNDGGKVRFGLGYGDKIPVLFDLAAGRLADQPQPTAGLVSPDVMSLDLNHWYESYGPTLEGKPLGVEKREYSRSVAIAPGGAFRARHGSVHQGLRQERQRTLWSKRGAGIAWGVNIPRDGKFVVVAYGDGTIRWLRLSDGEEVLALFVNAKTREWVLWTPQGYYASSVAGDKYPKLDAIHWLHYAAADARLLLDTLTKKAGPLHTEVRSKLLVTDGDTSPTKANIDDALLFFHDAGPDDTVVLFLAGHGENEGADYLFMPEDAEEVNAKYFRPSKSRVFVA
ncbi:MAG: hypothetical protein ACLPJY_11175 [Rhodomicrobium sp.]